jgi:threonine dehydrogenase-like Zn-dependent dehydrogenase
VPGVYGGFLDKIPFGAAMNKGLTFKMGQTHMQKYMAPLLKLVEDGKIDPSLVVTHRVRLSKSPKTCPMFFEKRDRCIKVVLDPAA